MITPYIPTIHIEEWQGNGFPVVAAFNINISPFTDGESGEVLHPGIQSIMPDGESLMVQSCPYPHWRNNEDTWVRCHISMDSSEHNVPPLKLWRGGYWTDVTIMEMGLIIPFIRGRIKRVAKALFIAASGIPAHDA